MKHKYGVMFALLLSLPLTVLGQTGTLSGQVIDATGDALPGATIVVVSISLGATTDLDGNYTIQNVPTGTHSVEARFIGFSPETQEVTIVQGETLTLNFTMDEDAVLLDAVVVSGSRFQGRTAMESATPIDKLETEELERQGNGDLTETLRILVPSYTATPLTGDGAAFIRSTSLRGLPPDDVLFLVNSKRRHRSALIATLGAAMNAGAHAADIGVLPSIGLKSVEVLRNGAAAQYGSDAIAGVINMILRDSREGFEMQAQVGQWYEGETDLKIAANIGLPLTAKGFANLSAEYTDSPELSRGFQHASAIGVPGAKNPAMNWGRPDSRGLRTSWNLGLNLSETANVYMFGNYADTYGNYSFFYRPPGRADALSPVPLDPNDPSKGNFCWCDEFPAGFTPRFEGFLTDFSTVLGLDGKLANGLTYDVSGSYGANRLNYKLNGSLNASWGPDSQFDFSPGDVKQEDITGNLDLTYPVTNNFGLAGGLQFRRETYTMFEGDEQSWKPGPWAAVGQLIDPETGENYTSPGLSANGFTGTAPEIAGEFESENIAAYVEAEFDVTPEFLLQGAFRYEDYKEFGTTSDWKGAARYLVSPALTVRGSVSTGFRAPTPGQANLTAITTSFDGVTGMQVQEGTVRPTSPLAVSLGGKPLVPEDAFNVSLGVAARAGKWVSFTVDAYQVKVDNRIIKSRAIPLEGNALFTELAFYTNALFTETRGVDIVMYLTGSVSTDFSLAYNYNETEVTKQELVNGIEPVSESTIFNIENNLPKHRASATVVHRMGKLTGMFRVNFYGKAIDERGDREVVDPAFLADIELGYLVNPSVTIVAGANNLFHKFPNKVDTRVSQGMPYPRRTPIGYNGGIGYLRIVFRR